MRQIFWSELTTPLPEEYVNEYVSVATFDSISPIHGGSQTTTIYYNAYTFFRVTADVFNTKWWIGNIT